MRNLPPRVCKWLVDTSCQISQFQQIKTDKLKDTIKTAKDYDIDIEDIRTKFQAGEKVLKFPKFTMIFSKGNDADMTTYLTRECEGVDASAYTKEYYYKFADGVNSVSILCPTKGLSEDVIIAIFDEIEKSRNSFHNEKRVKSDLTRLFFVVFCLYLPGKPFRARRRKKPLNVLIIDVYYIIISFVRLYLFVQFAPYFARAELHPVRHATSNKTFVCVLPFTSLKS